MSHVINENFFRKKPVIGVIHLMPLPGSPRYNGNFEEVFERAFSDAKSYVEGGIDAVIVENFGDKPFAIRVREAETLAAISVISYAIKKEFNIPLGINVLRNSGVEALGIAHVVKADFIRVNSLCQVLTAPEGIIKPIARELALKKKVLNENTVMVFADVNVKHATPLGKADLEYVVKECEERGLADAIIVTGERTGSETPIENVVKAKGASYLPVIVGSGVNYSNIEKYWKYADGFIIGTYFKVKNKVDNPVDAERVRKLMEKVRRLRESLQ